MIFRQQTEVWILEYIWSLDIDITRYETQCRLNSNKNVSKILHAGLQIQPPLIAAAAWDSRFGVFRESEKTSPATVSDDRRLKNL